MLDRRFCYCQNKWMEALHLNLFRHSKDYIDNQFRSRKNSLYFTLIVGVAIPIFLFILYMLLGVHNVGPRTLSVNGEDVESINGFSIRFTTWLSRSQVQTFLKHIQTRDVVLPTQTIEYHGGEFIRANDLTLLLRKLGNKATFTNGRLNIDLKPGLHYSYQTTKSTVVQMSVLVNGRLKGYVLAEKRDNVPYVSSTDIASVLTHSGLKSTWNENTFSLALTRNPPQVVHPLGNDQIIQFGNGKTIYAPGLRPAIATNSSFGQSTYLSVYSIAVALKKLGWNSSFDTWTWKLTVNPPDAKASSFHVGTSPKANVASAKTMVLGFAPVYFGGMGPFKDVLQHKSIFNAVAADSWTINDLGDLEDSSPTGMAHQSTNVSIASYATVTNLKSNGFNTKEINVILNDSSRSGRLQNKIVQAVVSKEYNGAVLDFELVPPSDRNTYTEFIRSLAVKLHTVGKRLLVVIPPNTGFSADPWNSGYDIAQIGSAADAVIVMAYDYSYAGSKPGPIAPLPWVKQVLAYTVSQMPVNHVILGIDAYGYDWVGKNTKALSLSNIDSFLASQHIHLKWNNKAKAPWFSWTDSHGAVHIVYFENKESTSEKLTLAQTYGIAGVALWRAGLEDNAILSALSEYVKDH